MHFSVYYVFYSQCSDLINARKMEHIYTEYLKEHT
jgi:hypothetical protein